MNINITAISGLEKRANTQQPNYWQHQRNSATGLRDPFAAYEATPAGMKMAEKHKDEGWGWDDTAMLGADIAAGTNPFTGVPWYGAKAINSFSKGNIWGGLGNVALGGLSFLGAGGIGAGIKGAASAAKIGGRLGAAGAKAGGKLGALGAAKAGARATAPTKSLFPTFARWGSHVPGAGKIYSAGKGAGKAYNKYYHSPLSRVQNSVANSSKLGRMGPLKATGVRGGTHLGADMMSDSGGAPPVPRASYTPPVNPYTVPRQGPIPVHERMARSMVGR